MQVTCEDCGVEATIAHPLDDGDPDQDGWSYTYEDVTAFVDAPLPNGQTQQVEVTYKKPVGRYVEWLCENGHLNTVMDDTYEGADA